MVRSVVTEPKMTPGRAIRRISTIARVATLRTKVQSPVSRTTSNFRSPVCKRVYLLRLLYLLNSEGVFFQADLSDSTPHASKPRSRSAPTRNPDPEPRCRRRAPGLRPQVIFNMSAKKLASWNCSHTFGSERGDDGFMTI